MKKARTYILFFVGIIFMMVLSLTLVWLIPDSMIRERVDEGVGILIDEGQGWPEIFSHNAASQLDNNTDIVMLYNTLSLEQDNSPIQNAMSINGYSRYWHGYLVFLRPLLSIMSYTSIRYLYMIIFMLLLGANIMLIGENISKVHSYMFIITMSMGYFVIIPFSLQFSSVFMIMMIANMILLKRNILHTSLYKLGLFFMIVGMITNFVDFLTAPLLTLGIPLTLALLQLTKDDLTIKDNTKKSMLMIIMSSMMWGVGYAATWISKWLLGSFILKTNVIEDAMNQAQIRTQGDGQQVISPVYALMNNIKTIIPPVLKNVPHLSVVIGVLFVVIIVFFILSIDKVKTYKSLPITILTLYPYLWYLVLVEHSQRHFIFTYREQLIAVFAFCCFYVNSIREKK